MIKFKKFLFAILFIAPLVSYSSSMPFIPGEANGIANIAFNANAFNSGDGNLEIKLISISYYTGYNSSSQTCTGLLGTIPGDSGPWWNTGISLPTTATTNIGHIGLIGSRLDQDVQLLSPQHSPQTGDCVIYNTSYLTSNSGIAINGSTMLCHNLIQSGGVYTSCTPLGNVTLTRSAFK